MFGKIVEEIVVDGIFVYVVVYKVMFGNWLFILILVSWFMLLVLG